ncbi:hypothetical protein N7489_004811 [Penicillium chrysogenum]|uniref:uncharacterized protein n=1 Tax=Penicillium chrysogenum TaxID=5076 RepID=UPI0024DF27BD|nr:uncharacterized protein N7489_004811 [Penicillium chrysogenum]KAJ5244715.1 hypothetical protein N7489_004811 [Penicillium chrysogenum]
MSNMMFHLSKHGIFSSGLGSNTEEDRSSIKQPSITGFFQKRAEMRAKALGQDLVRSVVTDEMEFDAIESAAFNDCEYDVWQKRLIEEIEQTCQTISLLLVAWTSKDSKSTLGVIGHWLTAYFQYQERVLEFTEIHGVRSGGNTSEIIWTLPGELRIEHKLLAITADNATNNEGLLSELCPNLNNEVQGRDAAASDAKSLRFQGADSYIRCSAHVLNLIVGDVLSMLKAGDHPSAVACDLVQENKVIGPQSPLARLRIMALQSQEPHSGNSSGK